MKFSIKKFSSRCDQIHKNLQIWSHLLEKILVENFISCEVNNSRIFNIKNAKFSGYCFYMNTNI